MVNLIQYQILNDINKEVTHNFGSFFVGCISISQYHFLPWNNFLITFTNVYYNV